MKILPLFKSHYSIGRSTLTLEKKGTSSPSEASSIIDIAVENDLKQVVLIEDSFSSFLEAQVNLNDIGASLIFGLRLTFCANIQDKSEESLASECKYVVFAKNANGYKRLIKLWKAANFEGFYYVPRIDFPTLKKYWSNDDLALSVPFYDSFLYQNIFTFATCVPDFSFTSPSFFLESNQHPLDDHLATKVKDYAKTHSFEVIPAKSIYYKEKKDFLAYLTFRCINNRSTIYKPQLDHFCSEEFCVESWKEQNNE